VQYRYYLSHECFHRSSFQPVNRKIVSRVLLLTESDPSIAGTAKLIPEYKAHSHDPQHQEAADVDELCQVITVEDKVKPRYM